MAKRSMFVGMDVHKDSIDIPAQGEECVVVNTSSMRTRSGDRVRTDRRDGDALARGAREDAVGLRLCGMLRLFRP